MLRDGTLEMRQVYVDTLMELAQTDKNIIVMEADLGGSIGSSRFKNQYPEQYINCGIMEANMVGVAAGLSLTGKKPFIHTFGSFASRRDFDQIFISLAYAGLDAVILGSDAGVSSEFNGGTHMPFEDIGLMRMIPTCNVVEASDELMLKQLLKLAYQKGGLWYIRTSRKKLPRIYEVAETFELGQGKVLKDGKDIAIMAYGISVADSCEAAQALQEIGIDAAIIDMFSIQPIDRDIILKYLAQTKAILTVENHQVVNGLGTAVAEVIAESGQQTKFKRLGVQGRYGQTGSANFLKKEYGIDKDTIINTAISLIL